MCMCTFYNENMCVCVCMYVYTLQGFAIFFFHVVRNKEVCTCVCRSSAIFHLCMCASAV